MNDAWVNCDRSGVYLLIMESFPFVFCLFCFFTPNGLSTLCGRSGHRNQSSLRSKPSALKETLFKTPGVSLESPDLS